MLEPTCHGGTARSGTSPGYLAAPGHHLQPVHHQARRVAQIAWLAGRRVAGALAGAGSVLVGVYKINASNAMPKPYLHVTVYIRTYARAHARARSRTVLANARNRKRTRTQINARKRIVAFDAWAISVCKRVCVLRVRSKTFRMYYIAMSYTHSIGNQS